MKRSLKNCRILSFVLMAHLAGSLRTLAESKSEPNLGLTVRVFNYAQASPETWRPWPERLLQTFLVKLESKHLGWNVRYPLTECSPFRIASNL